MCFVAAPVGPERGGLKFYCVLCCSTSWPREGGSKILRASSRITASLSREVRRFSPDVPFLSARVLRAAVTDMAAAARRLCQAWAKRATNDDIFQNELKTRRPLTQHRSGGRHARIWRDTRLPLTQHRSGGRPDHTHLSPKILEGHATATHSTPQWRTARPYSPHP